MLASATRVEGPGLRFALWFQGCPLRCRGCFNPHFFESSGGTDYSVEGLLDLIAQELSSSPELEGVTLLGGEPLAQPVECAELVRGVRDLGLSVLVFTGYTMKHLVSRADPQIMEIVANSDVVVAGPFLENKLDRARPWLGSENQEYHFISDRYGPADFTGPDGIEISIEKDGKVTLNGWAPSEDLMQLRHLGTEEPA